MIPEPYCHRDILYTGRFASYDTQLSGNHYAISLVFLQAIHRSPCPTYPDRTQSAVDLVPDPWTLRIPSYPYRLHGLREGHCGSYASQDKLRRRHGFGTVEAWSLPITSCSEHHHSLSSRSHFHKVSVHLK
jgi:hypothetical protein